MILVTTDYISGKDLEMLGLVKGSTIQSKNIGRDITQGFKTLVGGELGAYTEMMNDARVRAAKLLISLHTSAHKKGLSHFRDNPFFQLPKGLEPLTYALRMRRSTN